MKWIGIWAISGALLLNCQNVTEGTDNGPGTPTPPAQEPDDLPQPALDTVEMSLNGARFTLTNKINGCHPGDIGFAIPGGTPTLFLHGADLAATGNVLIKSGTPNWHMDIDDNAGGATWGTAAAGCNATVVENAGTTFELKAVGCDIKNQFGAQTGKVSFRVRCTKGN